MRRNPLVLVLVAAAAVVVAVVIGVIIAVNGNSSQTSSHSVATLKAVLDRVPLPRGATLLRETANEEAGDANAYVERQYRLPAEPPPSEQVHAALVKADCRLVDLRTGAVNSVASADWASLVRPDTGDLMVLPRGTKGGGIELNWNGTTLTVSVKGGDAELS